MPPVRAGAGALPIRPEEELLWSVSIADFNHDSKLDILVGGGLGAVEECEPAVGEGDRAVGEPCGASLVVACAHGGGGPWPVGGGVFHQVGAERISFDVAHGDEEVAVLLDGEGFEAALPDVAG